MPVQATHHVGFYKHFLPYWFSNRNASTRAYIDKPCPRRGSSSLAGKIIHPNYSCLIITFGVTCRLKYKLHIRILTLRFIDWYINELILRGSGFWGGRGGVSGNFGGVLKNFTEPLSQDMKIFLGSSAQARFDWRPCWAIWLKGGIWVPGHRNAWNAPK